MYNLYFLDKDSKIENQILNIYWISYEKKLNTPANLTFEIDINDKRLDNKMLRELKRVNIYKVDKTWENLLIDWFIMKINSNKYRHKIFIWDFWKMLEHRIITNDISFSSREINLALKDIFWYINSNFDSKIVVDCKENERITKDFSAGTNVLSIIKSIADVYYDFYFDRNILRFWKEIWKDLSENWEKINFIYDEKEKWITNIDDIEINRDIKNFSNAVLETKNNLIYRKNQESIDELWVISEKSITSDGQKVLWELSFWSIEYDIKPIEDDFFSKNVWDKVLVYVDIWNEINTFRGELKIVSKTLKTGIKDDIKIKLSSWRTKGFSLEDYLKNLEFKTNNL